MCVCVCVCECVCVYIYIYIFFFFAFSGHTCGLWRFPGYGSNQSYSSAAGLHHSHSNARSELSLPNLHHSSGQHLALLNPLSKARDRTHNLMVPSQIRFRCTMTGTPTLVFFNGQAFTSLLLSFKFTLVFVAQIFL